MAGNLINGAQTVLECLAREKVEVIFGYPGGVTLPFYDAIYDSPIKHVLVRHEQNAAFAAQGAFGHERPLPKTRARRNGGGATSRPRSSRPRPSTRGCRRQSASRSCSRAPRP